MTLNNFPQPSLSFSKNHRDFSFNVPPINQSLNANYLHVIEEEISGIRMQNHSENHPTDLSQNHGLLSSGFSISSTVQPSPQVQSVPAFSSFFAIPTPATTVFATSAIAETHCLKSTFESQNNSKNPTLSQQNASHALRRTPQTRLRLERRKPHF